MGNYSIKELERLSGIKAHTIRMWESRHNLITPKRTKTNIRYYSDQDLKKLLNVSILNQQGYKISKICELSAEELTAKVNELSPNVEDASVEIERLVLAMVQLDEINFEKMLSNLTVRFGFEETIQKVIYPFLEKIGVLWLTGNINPAHEHFISNLIRQKVIVAIDSLPIAIGTDKPRFLLFLPEHELHELGLLFANYVIRQQGFDTIYLGQSVPYPDLEKITTVKDFDYLLTYFISPLKDKNLSSYLVNLSNDYPGKKILVSGLQTSAIKSDELPNITIFEGIRGLKELLNSI